VDDTAETEVAIELEIVQPARSSNAKFIFAAEKARRDVLLLLNVAVFVRNSIAAAQIIERPSAELPGPPRSPIKGTARPI